MRVLRHLAGRHRTRGTNRALGLLLAFNAGAVNAGGFLAVNLYTSHMTGFLSLLADSLVLGNMALVLSAVGILWAFLSGAGKPRGGQRAVRYRAPGLLRRHQSAVQSSFPSRPPGSSERRFHT